MIFTPGSWLSRLVALAILMLLLLAAYQLIVQPALDLYKANDQRVTQMSNLLERYQRLATSQSLIADRLADIKEQGSSADGYWAGPSDALAAAQMQDRVSLVIEAHGGEVVSVQIINETTAEGSSSTRQAELGLRLATTMAGLAAIVHDLETTMPYMFIDRLIVTPERKRRASEANGGPAVEPKLDVRLNVFGYVQQADLASDDPMARDG